MPLHGPAFSRPSLPPKRPESLSSIHPNGIHAVLLFSILFPVPFPESFFKKRRPESPGMIPARRSLSSFSTLFSAMLALSGALAARAEVLPASSATPPVLTAEEAVRLGLENNFALALVRSQTDLATLNRQTGIGPFLPTASADARYSGRIDSGSPSQTTVGVSANIQLFNGFQSTFAYRRLKAQETAATLRQDAAVENTVESILTAYYGIAGQKLQLNAIREALLVSEERAKLARARMEVGAGSRLEQLQSQADLNADSSSLMSQETALREAKIQLNGLLARDAGTDFDVPDTIPVEAALPLENWRATLPERNNSIREARIQRRAAEFSVSEARGGRLPSVNAGLSYNTAPEALNSQATASNGSDAVSYSVSASLPLFDGLRTRQSVGSSRIALRQQETSLRRTEQETRAAYAQAAGRYESGLRQIALEERNLEVARLQAEAARERFRVGSSTSLEFRDAQQTLLNAQSRLATVRQTVKQSELALKRLAGVLASPVSPEN
jgi:outer membrane protein